LILMTSCTAKNPAVVGWSEADPDEVLVTVYLETRGLCSGEGSLSLSNFTLHNGQNQVPLFLDDTTLDCMQTSGQQILLGMAKVPADNYDGLGLTLTQQPSGKDNPLEQNLVCSFARGVQFNGGDSQCLFVVWSPPSIANDTTGGVNITANPQQVPLSRDLIYLLCADINTLYLARSDNRFVVAAIGLDGKAGEMAIDSFRQRLYLVNRSRQSLQVFDLNAQRLIDRIPLPLTVEPYRLALDLEKNVAFVTDSEMRRVLQVELDDGQIGGNLQIGLQPGGVVYFSHNGVGMLAVSDMRKQRVYLLDAATLTLQTSIETDRGPNHLVYDSGSLYVAEEGGQSLSVFSVDSGARVGRVRMYGQPGEVMGNSVDGKIYVANLRTHSLDVVSRGQFTRMRSIPLGASLGALAQSVRRGQIFVANPAERTMTALDRASEHILGTIPFASPVTDIAVYE
jgi:DNA-binding beta-propeller fold protein YncE